jgi:hypothetical protein
VTPTEINDLALQLGRLESQVLQRLDDIVRRIDGFERRLDKHQDMITDLKYEVTLWKGGLLLLGIIFPLILKFWS